LLSDNGLDDETPESDAHDFTDAERTIFGGISSGDGDVAGIVLVIVIDVSGTATKGVDVVSEGHEEIVDDK
jgi:hypothetical protein